MARQNRNRGRRGGHGTKGTIRSDRIGSMLRDIIADELRRLDDEDGLGYITVTDVVVDNELTLARVYLSTLDLHEDEVEPVRANAGRFKRAIGERARIKRVPDLEFMIDPALVSGNRVDAILAGMSDDRAFVNQLAADDAEEE